MSLLTELDAFYTEHQRCGELEAGVEGPTVWFACREHRAMQGEDNGWHTLS